MGQTYRVSLHKKKENRTLTTKYFAVSAVVYCLRQVVFYRERWWKKNEIVFPINKTHGNPIWVVRVKQHNNIVFPGRDRFRFAIKATFKNGSPNVNR